MLDSLFALLGQVHPPVFDGKYSADQAIAKATLQHEEGNDTLTVVFLPWHTPEIYVRMLHRHLAKAKTSVLTYYFNQHLIESDVTTVKDSFEYVALAIASDVDNLQQSKGYARTNLLGISLGNVSLCITAEKIHQFDDVIMVVPGSSLAAPLWTGWRTRRLRHMLEQQGASLSQLQSEWIDLAPSSHAEALAGHDVHIVIAKHDKFIPTKYGQELAEELRSISDTVTVTTKPFGHMATILSYNAKHTLEAE